LKNITLPSVTLALLMFSIITRITSSSILETTSKDFIRTVKAKVLAKNRVTVRHTLRFQAQ